MKGACNTNGDYVFLDIERAFDKISRNQSPKGREDNYWRNNSSGAINREGF